MLDQKAMNERTTHGGKGDAPRQIAGDKFRSNYDRIFKKHESNPINPRSSEMETRGCSSIDGAGVLAENDIIQKRRVLGKRR
jgi:hypothetical protein